MAEIRVVTDNSCDLPAELTASRGITVVPLIVRYGDEVFDDTALTKEEFWRRAEVQPPCTSGAALGNLTTVFRELVGQGYHVLCLTLTGRHSSVYSSAWTAAQEFPDKVTVYDSRSISWGLGWQVLAAAEAAVNGQPLEKILEMLGDIRSRVRIEMALDTLSFVRRGGRADAFISIIDRAARALRIRPIIGVVDGELRLAGMSRTLEAGARRLLDDFSKYGSLEVLAVGHTQRLEQAKALARELADATGVSNPVVFETGVAIASHSGPGLLAAIGLTAK